MKLDKDRKYFGRKGRLFYLDIYWNGTKIDSMQFGEIISVYSYSFQIPSDYLIDERYDIKNLMYIKTFERSDVYV